MRRAFFLVIAVLLVVTVSVFSCKKTNLSPSTQIVPLGSGQPNKPPVADAGADLTVVLPSNSCDLIGKGTDQDGRLVSYVWTIEAYYSLLGQYALFTYKEQNVILKNLLQGWYWATLTITDDGGLTAKDHVVIRVVAKDCPCYPDPCDAFGDPCDPWDY